MLNVFFFFFLSYSREEALKRTNKNDLHCSRNRTKVNDKKKKHIQRTCICLCPQLPLLTFNSFPFFSFNVLSDQGRCSGRYATHCAALP